MNYVIIGTDKPLSLVPRQSVIQTNDDSLLISSLWTNVSGILDKFKKI